MARWLLLHHKLLKKLPLLDTGKEGFPPSETSLIRAIGRAAPC
jgi:excinuclease UvrABC helicase subunit UvrB